jgi:adenosylmethionine-8-amino-7-oxononanoate aminotransferase
MFASEHWDLVGDIMTMAKGLSSGYAPIAAAICRPHVVAPFAGEKKLSHLLTFGGHAVACAAALANIAIMQDEGMVENAAAMGTYMMAQLDQLRSHPTVGDVRGIGLLLGVELVKDKATKAKFAMESEEIKMLNDLLLDNGLLTRATHIISLSPPLCINRGEVDRIVDIVDRSLTTLEAKYGYR